MSKASSGWKQLLEQLLKKLSLQLKNQDWSKLSGRVFCLLGIALMWLWNWKLLLATVIGIGLMLSSYSIQNHTWQQYRKKYWQKWQRFLTGSNRQLTIAVGTGSMGGFGTYLTASILADSENPWLTGGLILQGFGTLTTLVLLVWYLFKSKQQSTETTIEKLIGDLTHADPLKRLIAIRQLTRLVRNNNLSPEYYRQSIEYYRLMLSQPQVPAVRDALLDSLELLDSQKLSNYQLSNHQAQPLEIPLQLQRDRQPMLDNFPFE